jgi:hypothetical protein
VTPIVPGKPEESEVVRRIFSNEEAEVMPPAEAHKTLTQAQKELIRRWIAEGAAYEGHWAFQPIGRPRVPMVGTIVNNPIDRFVQARLAERWTYPGARGRSTNSDPAGDARPDGDSANSGRDRGLCR